MQLFNDNKSYKYPTEEDFIVLLEYCKKHWRVLSTLSVEKFNIGDKEIVLTVDKETGVHYTVTIKPDESSPVINVTAVRNDTFNGNETETYLSGSIKWDGCSNFDLGDKDVMVHTCGVEPAFIITDLYLVAYRLAELMLVDRNNGMNEDFIIENKGE